MRELSMAENDFTPENASKPSDHNRVILKEKPQAGLFEGLSRIVQEQGAKPNPRPVGTTHEAVLPEELAAARREGEQVLASLIDNLTPKTPIEARKSPNPDEVAGRLMEQDQVPTSAVKPPTPEQVAFFENALKTKKLKTNAGEFAVEEEMQIGGVRALRAKDPKTGESIIFRLQQTEGVVGAQVAEFQPGLSLNQLRDAVRLRLANYELSPNTIDADTIKSLTDRINDYIDQIVGPVTPREVKKIVREAEARLNLTAANFVLNAAGLNEEFQKFYSALNPERFNILRDEVLGASGLEIMRRMELPDAPPPGGVSVGSGGFFRLGSAAKQAAIAGPGGFLEYMMVTDGITRDEAIMKYQVIDRLFNTSGMASFYVGPQIPAGMPGAGRLMDEYLMEQAVNVMVNAPAGGAPSYDFPNYLNPNPFLRQTPIAQHGQIMPPADVTKNAMLLYQRNEQYWNLKRQFRLLARNRGLAIGFAGGDSINAMRRVLYTPEELEARIGGREQTGKARSLFYAAESYVLPMTFTLGAHSLGEFMGPVGVQNTDHYEPGYSETAPSENLIQKHRGFRYAALVVGAASNFNHVIGYMNEPIKGEQNAGSRKTISDDLGNMVEFIKGLSYLGGYAPNILSFAVSRTLIGMSEYINGNSEDRRREFRKVPNFGPQTLYLIGSASFFNPLMDSAWKQETLNAMNSSEGRVQNIRTAEGVGQTGVSVLGALFKAISRK